MSGLISVMTAAVTGVIVFTIIKSMTSGLEEPVTGTAGVIMNILPILMGLLVLIGVFITVGSPEIPSRIREWFTNRKNDRYIYRLLQSQLLPPSSIIPTLNLKLEPIEGTVDEPVQISREQELLFSKEFSYYFTDKSDKYPMYKLVGLHNQHRNLNCIHIIGKDIHTGIPYLLRLPPNYIHKGLEECIRWCIQAGKGDIIKEV